MRSVLEIGSEPEYESAPGLTTALVPSMRMSFTRFPAGIIMVTSELASVTWTLALRVTLAGSCSGVRLAGSSAGWLGSAGWASCFVGPPGEMPVT